MSSSLGGPRRLTAPSTAVTAMPAARPAALPANWAGSTLTQSAVASNPGLYTSRDGKSRVDFLGRPIAGAPPVAAAGAPATTTVTNNAAADPGLTALSNMVSSRLNMLQSTENAPNTLDTERLKQRARGDIAGMAAGRQAALTETLAGSGGLGGGAEAAMRENVAGEADRAKARTSADIELEQQARQDQRNDQRRSETTGAMLSSLPIFQANPNLQLDQQRVGISQMGTAASIDASNREAAARDQDRQLSTLLALNSLYGNPLASASPSSIGWL